MQKDSGNPYGDLSFKKHPITVTALFTGAVGATVLFLSLAVNEQKKTEAGKVNEPIPAIKGL